jgi:hypothetical protein
MIIFANRFFTIIHPQDTYDYGLQSDCSNIVHMYDLLLFTIWMTSARHDRLLSNDVWSFGDWVSVWSFCSLFAAIDIINNLLQVKMRKRYTCDKSLCHVWLQVRMVLTLMVSSVDMCCLFQLHKSWVYGKVYEVYVYGSDERYETILKIILIIKTMWKGDSPWIDAFYWLWWSSQVSDGKVMELH